MSNPITLKVRNIGPVKKADIVFDKYTVFIGNQGSGKSTLAKLFSMFAWLEKALLRGYITVDKLKGTGFSQAEYTKFHRIQAYFKVGTFLQFNGEYYQFIYKEQRLDVTQMKYEHIQNTKIIYVPSERNLLSSVLQPRTLKGLSKALSAFNDDLDNAKHALIDKEAVPLPLDDINFVYDSGNDISWLAGSDYVVQLTDASSGFQSLVPLCLVTSYWSNQLGNNSLDALNKEEYDKLRAEIKPIMAMKEISDKIKTAMLQEISSKYSTSCITNIVEEMEQNLYPSSQKQILFFLLEHCNLKDDNRLVLTTHSPYLINYLSLAAKAQQIASMDGFNEDNTEHTQLYDIVPKNTLVDPDKLHIYEVQTNGQTVELDKFDNLPSDENLLNTLLGETNDLFNDLYDIEEACQG